MSNSRVSSGNTLKFRCIKITREEKRTSRYNEPEVLATTVECTFCSPEMDSLQLNGNPYLHAYLSVTLSIELYEKFGYQVGKYYELIPT